MPRLALLLAALLPATAFAQKIGWVGEGVMLRGDDTPAGRVLANALVPAGPPLDANLIYKVAGCSGGLLELKHEQLKTDAGRVWVRRADVVRRADAEAYFTARIVAEPKAGKWYGRRGLMRWGRTGPAAEDIDKAVELDPKCLLWKLWRVRNLCSERNPAAVVEAEELVRLAPDRDDLLTEQAGVLLFLCPDRSQEALKLIDRALTLNAKNSHGHYLSGYHKLLTRQYDAATEHFTKAIDLSPSYALAWSQRGLAQQWAGDADGAARDFAQAMTLEPENQAVIRAHMAYLLILPKADCRSITEGYVTLCRLLPHDPETWRDRAFWLAAGPDDTGRDGKAAVRFALKAMELTGDKAGVPHHATLAAAYAEAGEFDNAIAEQEIVIRLLESGLPASAGLLTEMKVRLVAYRGKKPLRK